MVDPVAAIQGVTFTRKQAEAVANLLNEMQATEAGVQEVVSSVAAEAQRLKLLSDLGDAMKNEMQATEARVVPEAVSSMTAEAQRLKLLSDLGAELMKRALPQDKRDA
jgi:hypothetical protein